MYCSTRNLEFNMSVLEDLLITILRNAVIVYLADMQEVESGEKKLLAWTITL